MALATSTVFNIQATATSGNVNGSGFNPANATMQTNLTTDANTANTASPIISSATYNFVAGDVGAKIYIQSGTNWTVGWYIILSVAANKATLSAAIGAAEIPSAGTIIPSTVIGCATVGTPTNGVFGIDYSALDTATLTLTDATSVGSSTTLTSVTGGFTNVMVGNFIYISTTGVGGFGLIGWYEIVTFVNTNTITTDRTTNNGTAGVGLPIKVGGAGRLNALEDAYYEMLPAGALVWIKNGTYVISASVGVSSTNGTVINPIVSIGYLSIRGDNPIGTNRPTLSIGANELSFGANQVFKRTIFTGTGTDLVAFGAGGDCFFCKFLNTSSSASRRAFNPSIAGRAFECESTSQNGSAVGVGTNLYGCYIHDSLNGVNGSGQQYIISGCVFEAINATAIINNAATAATTVVGNTIYGREAQMGVGISVLGAANGRNLFSNNIFYGLTTALSVATQANTNMGVINDYFNNGTDVTNFNKDAASLALNPQFVGAAQITGTTASGSGSVLTDTNADFSTVTDNVDFVRVLSGTGATVACFLITSHTATTLTCNNTVGTNATADRVYYVTTGHNFRIGKNLKGLGVPNFLTMSVETTSYPDPGAAQRQDLSTPFIIGG